MAPSTAAVTRLRTTATSASTCPVAATTNASPSADVWLGATARARPSWADWAARWQPTLSSGRWWRPRRWWCWRTRRPVEPVDHLLRRRSRLAEGVDRDEGRHDQTARAADASASTSPPGRRCSGPRHLATVAPGAGARPSRPRGAARCGRRRAAVRAAAPGRTEPSPTARSNSPMADDDGHHPAHGLEAPSSLGQPLHHAVGRSPARRPTRR